ncbi:unnamed protein product [Protopolystoma xenopodis]|uniref:Uncharacterized protein n=1 Tax=Protopolystoma xenopodis TaxID=117903 RepID=A0A448X548_9PLAT|nr:unnamed protein product [Protopolystoma xenopodis]
MLLAPTALDSHRPSPDGMSRSSSYSLHSSIIPIQDFGAVNSLVTTLSPSSKSYGLSTTSGSSNSLPTVIKSASSSTSLSTSFVSSPSFDGPLHQRNPSPNPRIVEKELNHSSGSTTNASSGRLFEPEDGQQHGQMMSLVSLTPLISAPGSFPMPSVKSSAQVIIVRDLSYLSYLHSSICLYIFPSPVFFVDQTSLKGIKSWFHGNLYNYSDS